MRGGEWKKKWGEKENRKEWREGGNTLEREKKGNVIYLSVFSFAKC